MSFCTRRLLAVGSQMGEVLLYTCSQDEHCVLTQTVQCGGSAITCATWMRSSKYVAFYTGNPSNQSGLPEIRTPQQSRHFAISICVFYAY